MCTHTYTHKVMPTEMMIFSPRVVGCLINLSTNYEALSFELMAREFNKLQKK